MESKVSEDAQSLVRTVHDLNQALTFKPDATAFEKNVLAILQQITDILPVVVAETKRLGEEQRGWSRGELSTDQPDAPQGPGKGEGGPRNWSRTSMSTDPGQD